MNYRTTINRGADDVDVMHLYRQRRASRPTLIMHLWTRVPKVESHMARGPQRVVT
jgi:hypothetical protein